MATPLILEDGKWTDLSLTDEINAVKPMTTQLSRLGLFEWRNLTSRLVNIGVNNGQVEVVPSAPPGAPAYQNTRTGRDVKTVNVPRFPIGDFVQAEEVQGAYYYDASGNALGIIAETSDHLRTTRAAELSEKLDNTIAHLEIGAVNGIVLDADMATPLVNLFDLLGVARTVVNFDLGNASSDTEARASDMARAISKGLNGDGRTGNLAICGASFYDALRNHPNTRLAFRESAGATSDGARRAVDITDGVYERFKLGTMIFERFEGELSGQPYVAANECQGFPVGSRIFKGAFAPAGFLDSVNRVALPKYLKTKEADFGTGIAMLAETWALAYCTRPAALPKGVA